jgi:hypothetical protein
MREFREAQRRSDDAVRLSPNASNLQIVELLIKNFDRPYKEASRGTR